MIRCSTAKHDQVFHDPGKCIILDMHMYSNYAGLTSDEGYKTAGCDSAYSLHCRISYLQHDNYLIACLQENLKHLRTLWDMVVVVMGAFSSWCATLWDKIDVDFLVEEAKRLGKEIRTLNKVVRAFDVYRCGLPSTLCASSSHTP